MPDEPANTRQPYYLRISGLVTVHYMDGETVQGEINAQDEANIFLTVDDNEPLLIPRLQIRCVRGTHGQVIEPDLSPQTFGVTRIPAERDMTHQSGLPLSDVDNDEVEGTVILRVADQAAYAEATESQDGTIVLDSSDSAFSTHHSSTDTPSSVSMGNRPTRIFADEESTPPPQSEVATPRFVCTDGPHAGQIFALDDAEITIGRASNNTIALVNDKEISRRHAVVEKQGAHYFIKDQNSLNGTYVNDVAAVGPRQINPGDVVLVGVSHLKFEQN